MHLLVIVVGDDVNEQLKPYQENNCGTCPEEYLEFYDVEDDYRENYLTGAFDCEWARLHYREHFGKPIRDVFATFEDYMEEFYGPRDEKTGRYGNWQNPNSQYDWYECGGRFSGHLILKPLRDGRPERADKARKGAIDFQAMSRERFQSYLASWEALEQEGQTGGWSAKWLRGIPESVTTREQLVNYARRLSAHTAPDAVVVGGEWFGPSRVDVGPREEAADRWQAWYGALLASLPDDTLLTVIDCHV